MLFSRPISIASGCFYYWLTSIEGLYSLETNLLNYLHRGNKLSGIEFHTDIQEFLAWGRSLKSGRRTLLGHLSYVGDLLTQSALNLSHNSVHLPSMRNVSISDAPIFAETMISIYEHTGITRFVVHPDELQIVTAAELLRQLPEEIKISIENMDTNKSSFRDLSEMECILDSFPKLTMTLDICHWIEHGRSADSRDLIQFLIKYQDRISAMHFSAPWSESQIYFSSPEIKTSHFLGNGSGVNFGSSLFEVIPKEVTIVCEGVIPKGDFLAFEREISYVSNLASAPVLPRLEREC